MPAIIYDNNDVVFGMHEPKPLKGFPEGKTKLKMRGDDWARVYVKTKDGIQEWYIKDDGENFVPFCRAAINERK